MAFEGLTQRLQQAFGKVRGKGSLTEEDVKLVMREVRMALLEADVNYKVVKDFVKKATERCIGQEAQNGLSTQQQVIKIVNEELTELMGGSNARLQYSSSPISVFMLCGLQGAGKTTMSAKLANWLKKDGKRPLLVGCDIYRPAAIKQLQVVGGQVGVPVYEHGTQDPVKTAQEAIEYARQHQRDVVILDTAGRLHIDEALMEELHRICEAVHPSEILLTIDAMTGQDAVNVANTFNEKLEITGVILTKLDGDTRGGAALSVRAVTGKPIKFAGTGEKLTDLEAFHPERMASRILGMGDVMTLIEKAQENIDIDPEQAGDLGVAGRLCGLGERGVLGGSAGLAGDGGLQVVKRGANLGGAAADDVEVGGVLGGGEFGTQVHRVMLLLRKISRLPSSDSFIENRYR